jgi:tetratricopeptide (TPR) repeat protein
MNERLKGIGRELSKRHVLRTAVLYLGAAWIALEFIGFLVDTYAIQRSILDVSLLFLGIGFPIAVIVSWFHGAGGRQRIVRLEVVLVGLLLLGGALGSVAILTRDRPEMRLAEIAPVGRADLGEGSVAVLPLTNNTGADSLDWLGPGLADMLTTNLAQLPALKVVSAQRLMDLMRQAGRDETDRIPEDLALDIAARSGAHTLVQGSFVAVGRDIRVDVQLIDLSDGTVSGAEQARGTDVFALVDEVSARLSGRLLGEPVEPTELTPLAELATGNLDAYREYQEGLRAERRFLYEEAEEHYRRALEQDSTFAMAWLRLGMRYGQDGNNQQATFAFQKAEEHSEGASERDRLMIEAMFAFIALDPTRSVNHLEELAAKYPDEKEARFWLALAYQQQGRTDGYRRVLEEAVQLDPFYAPAVNQLLYLAAAQGDEAAADSLSLRYLELEPDQPNPYDSRGEALERFGRYEEARAAYREAIRIRPGFAFAYDHLARTYLRQGDPAGARRALLPYMETENPVAAVEVRLLTGDAYVAEGRYLDGLAEYRRAAGKAAEIGRDDLRLPALDKSGSLAVLTGAYEAAEQAFEEMYRIDPFNQGALFGMLTVYGLSGRLDEMHRIRDLMAAGIETTPPYLRSTARSVLLFTDGVIAHYEGDPETCVRLFREGREALGPQGAGVVSREEFESLIEIGQAGEVLERADWLAAEGLSEYGGGRQNPLAAHAAPYVRARAYEVLGDTAAALQNYEELLELAGEGAREVELFRDAPERAARLRGGADQ